MRSLAHDDVAGLAKGPLWKITGRLRNLGETSPSKWDHRTVLLVASDFDDAVARAEDALILNWSRRPHEVEVRSIAPVLEEREQLEIIHPSTENGGSA